MTPFRPIRLIKAHAYGNDFLIVAANDVAAIDDLADLARRACDRHRGVGADGLMLVADTPGGARMRLFNADGSRSELSGNGARCVGAWLASARGLGEGDRVTIETEAGPKVLTVLERVHGRAEFRAAMGPPEQIRQVEIEVDGQPVAAVVLRVGNPQCVVLGPATADRLATLAAKLAVHPVFPAGSNVELAHVDAPDRVRILIWERGVGPTEASGTGACASAVAAIAYGGAARDVQVVSPGGAQRVEWTDAGLFLTGWAEVLFDGRWTA